MKPSSYLSFIFAFIVYSLLLITGYWLWVSYKPAADKIEKLTPVPVSLAMFAAPHPVKPAIKPIIEPTPEPVVKELIEPIVKPEPKIIEPPKEVTKPIPNSTRR